MFRTDLLSIIRSPNAVFTATGICYTSCVDYLLTRSDWTVILAETCRLLYQNKVENSASCWLLLRTRIYHNARSCESQIN